MKKESRITQKVLRLLMGVLILGVGVSEVFALGIPEAGILLYGRVLDENRELLTSGDLEWTYTPQSSDPAVSHMISLEEIDGPGGEKFSYVLILPCESVLPGEDLAENTLRYPVGNVTYTREATFNDQTLFFHNLNEEATREHTADDHRGGAFRVDLGLTPCSLLDPPANVMASDGDFEEHVRVSWDGVSGATQYEIWRSLEDNSGTSFKVGESATSPFDDVTTFPGIIYHYWVRSINECGTGDFSASDSGFRGSLPTPTLTPSPTTTPTSTFTATPTFTPLPTTTPTLTPDPTTTFAPTLTPEPTTPTLTFTATPTITVAPTQTPVISPELDTDGDGYSDSYENSIGTDPNNPADKPPLGNVDGNEEVNITDAILLYRAVLGKVGGESVDLSPTIADINGDGVVNLLDAIMLYRWTAGIPGFEVLGSSSP